MVWAAPALAVAGGWAIGRWRGRAVGIAAAATIAGTVWAIAGYVAGARADEMAAIPPLVAGALATWLLAFPGALAITILELRRRRSDEVPLPPG